MNSTTSGQIKEGETAGRVQRAQAPMRRTALVSARRRDCARQRPNKFTILCDSQKHITCLDVHCNACWKHFNSSTDQNQKTERDEDLLFVCLLLPLMPAMEICAFSSRLTYAAENSHKHHQTHDIHAILLAEQSLGESVMAISPSTPQRLRLSEYLEALLPVECVPEISLCLEPALNRGSLR